MKYRLSKEERQEVDARIFEYLKQSRNDLCLMARLEVMERNVVLPDSVYEGLKNQECADWHRSTKARVLDASLQRLRRRGAIRFTGMNWEVV